MASKIKLTMKPKGAQRFLDDIKKLSKPKSGRPLRLSSTPDLTDHALFLFLLNSTPMKNWLSTVSPENSFKYMRILCEIQKMGLVNFKKWLKQQSERQDPTNPDDPRNNQRFFDEQWSMEQFAIITAEELNTENLEKDRVLHHFVDVVMDSEWVREAETHHDTHTSFQDRNGSMLLCALAGSLGGLHRAAETKTNPAVAKASYELRTLLENEDSPHYLNNASILKYIPQLDNAGGFSEDEEDA